MATNRDGQGKPLQVLAVTGMGRSREAHSFQACSEWPSGSCHSVSWGVSGGLHTPTRALRMWRPLFRLSLLDTHVGRTAFGDWDADRFRGNAARESLAVVRPRHAPATVLLGRGRSRLGRYGLRAFTCCDLSCGARSHRRVGCRRFNEECCLCEGLEHDAGSGSAIHTSRTG